MGWLRLGRIRVSGGFLLWISFLWYCGMGEALLWLLLAAILHELGHLTAARLMGVNTDLLLLTAVGAELVMPDRKLLGHGKQLLLALAGPLMNFLLLFLPLSPPPLAGACALLGCFNLLPILPLDGGELLLHILALLGPEDLAERVARLVSHLLAGLLLLAGGWLAWVGSNFSLLLLGGWLLWAGLGKLPE